MKRKNISVNGKEYSAICANTIVVGTGCAGFNAADCLYNLGLRDIAIVTEGINSGTSRNTGSDKQTYYKLSLSGDEPDSVKKLAETLYNGGSVHGDNALAEAAGSVSAFIKFTELGLPFPRGEYGEFAGYKTDHDPLRRAASCGPYTSKLMTEALEREVRRKDIPIVDNLQVIKLLQTDSRLYGAVSLEKSGQPVIILCNNMILCTGGTASAYYDSVYPLCHTGSGGLAANAGVTMNNLQEWQYGLASVKFRWNVSGSYQQVLPRYVSVDKNGKEREFLSDCFSPEEALKNVFLKGYQWPFDAAKINGSSAIDLIVHKETKQNGNRVFMDFTRNPEYLTNFSLLPQEAAEYLSRSGALGGTPLDRLEKMNPSAVELYKSNNINLSCEMLEIAVCAQHSNGGIAVDANWQTSLKGLYAAGEAAGTFGVYRPGGAALNSTQVGAKRAAEHIFCTTEEKEICFNEETLTADLKEIEKILSASFNGSSNSHFELREELQKEMSKYAAHLRDLSRFEEMTEKRKRLKTTFFSEYMTSAKELGELFKTYDVICAQLSLLSAIRESGECAGSRGSALILSESGGNYIPEDEKYRGFALETKVCGEGLVSRFVPVRPIPKTDDWFENVWREYRKRFGILS